MRSFSRRFLIVVYCAALVPLAACQKPKAPNATFAENQYPVKILSDGTAKYRVYVPPNLKTQDHPPIMLFLHGSDDRGDDNQSQLNGVDPLIKAHPEFFSFIVVFPQCPRGRIFDDQMIRTSIDELDAAAKDFNADISREYLAGFSLGGYGVWITATQYPNKFAAVVPMSGRVDVRSGERRDLPPDYLKLAIAPDPYAALADRLKGNNIWIFHGSNDNIVPVENSRQMFKALKAAGDENVHYSEVPNIGHVSVNAAFSDADLFAWLAGQRLSGDQ